MQTAKLHLIIVLTTVTALLLSACGGGGSTSSSGQKTFDVVVVAPMSGQLASYGTFTEAAYRASVDVVNARGGILGRQVKMTVLDDKGDPTTGVSALSAYLSTNAKPDLVYPGATSSEVQGTAPFLAKKGILAVSAAALPAMNNPAMYPLYFSTNTDQKPAVDKIVQYVKSKGWTKIGLISSNDQAGDQISANLDKAVGGTGLVVDKVLFSPNALDVTPEMQKLRADAPDVVLMDAVGEKTLRIVKARQGIGWKIPVIGGVQSGGADFSKVDPIALDGIQTAIFAMQKFVPIQNRSNSFNTFYEAVLKAEHNNLNFSLYYYGVDYDTLQVVAVAAQQAQSTDLKQIGAALENLKQPNEADRPWVLFKREGFSPDNHLNVSTADDYAIVPATPLNQGFTGKPAA